MIAAGVWVQLTADARRAVGLPAGLRGCVEQLAGADAWVRFVVDGWPFPLWVKLPQASLQLAPAPRRQKLSGKIEA